MFIKFKYGSDKDGLINMVIILQIHISLWANNMFYSYISFPYHQNHIWNNFILLIYKISFIYLKSDKFLWNIKEIILKFNNGRFGEEDDL